jgi:hypothetical protein
LIVPLLAFILVAGYPWLLFSLNQLLKIYWIP